MYKMSVIHKLYLPFFILLNMILLTIIRKQRKHAVYQSHYLMKSAFSESNFPPQYLLEQSMKQARETLDIAIYNFDNPAIAESLTQAKHRGLHIRVLVDETKANKQKVEQIVSLLKIADIPVRLHASEKMHLKMTIMDQTTLIIGSFNYTDASVNENVEQLFKISNRTEAQKWTAIFNELWDFSQK